MEINNNIVYAPGLPSYSLPGKDGSIGLQGIGVYVTDYSIENTIDLNLLITKLKLNKLPFRAIDSSLPDGRLYINGDSLIDKNGKTYILDISSGEYTLTYVGVMNNTEYLVPSINPSTNENIINSFGKIRVSNNSNCLIDSVNSSQEVVNYLNNQGTIYGVDYSNFSTVNYTDISINSNFESGGQIYPYTLYTLGEVDTGTASSNLAVVYDINNSAYRIGNSNRLTNIIIDSSNILVNKPVNTFSYNEYSSSVLTTNDVPCYNLLSSFTNNPDSFNVAFNPITNKIDVSLNFKDFTHYTSDYERSDIEMVLYIYNTNYIVPSSSPLYLMFNYNTMGQSLTGYNLTASFEGDRVPVINEAIRGIQSSSDNISITIDVSTFMDYGIEIGFIQNGWEVRSVPKIASYTNYNLSVNPTVLNTSSGDSSIYTFTVNASIPADSNGKKFNVNTNNSWINIVNTDNSTYFTTRTLNNSAQSGSVTTDRAGTINIVGIGQIGNAYKNEVNIFQSGENLLNPQVNLSVNTNNVTNIASLNSAGCSIPITTSNIWANSIYSLVFNIDASLDLPYVWYTNNNSISNPLITGNVQGNIYLHCKYTNKDNSVIDDIVYSQVIGLQPSATGNNLTKFNKQITINNIPYRQGNTQEKVEFYYTFVSQPTYTNALPYTENIAIAHFYITPIKLQINNTTLNTGTSTYSGSSITKNTNSIPQQVVYIYVQVEVQPEDTPNIEEVSPCCTLKLISEPIIYGENYKYEIVGNCLSATIDFPDGEGVTGLDYYNNGDNRIRMYPSNQAGIATQICADGTSEG